MTSEALQRFHLKLSAIEDEVDFWNCVYNETLSDEVGKKIFELNTQHQVILDARSSLIAQAAIPMWMPTRDSNQTAQPDTKPVTTGQCVS